MAEKGRFTRPKNDSVGAGSPVLATPMNDGAGSGEGASKQNSQFHDDFQTSKKLFLYYMTYFIHIYSCTIPFNLDIHSIYN